MRDMAVRTQVSRLGTESFIPKGTQKPTEGTDLKHPTTLGEPKWHKSHTVVSSMIPMIRKTLKSQSHNLLTEELSTQLLLLN